MGLPEPLPHPCSMQMHGLPPASEKEWRQKLESTDFTEKQGHLSPAPSLAVAEGCPTGFQGMKVGPPM